MYTVRQRLILTILPIIILLGLKMFQETLKTTHWRHATPECALYRDANESRSWKPGVRVGDSQVGQSAKAEEAARREVGQPLVAEVAETRAVPVTERPLSER